MVVVGGGQAPGIVSPVVAVVVAATCRRAAVVVMVIGKVMIRTRIRFLGPGQTQGYCKGTTLGLCLVM